MVTHTEIERATATVQELSPRVQSFLEEVKEFTIIVPEHYQEAGDWLRSIKGRLKEVEDRRKSLTSPLDEVKKRIMDLFRPIEAIYSQAETLLKDKIKLYRDEQERIRQEQETKARVAAAKEQQRLQGQADTKAAKLEQRGLFDAAAEVRNAVPEVTLPVIPQTEVPKVAGLAFREHWSFRITDADQVPREYCSPDEKKIRAVVEALKANTNIPGVEVWRDDSVASGRG
jgi:hypothetical protein